MLASAEDRRRATRFPATSAPPGPLCLSSGIADDFSTTSLALQQSHCSIASVSDMSDVVVP